MTPSQKLQEKHKRKFQELKKNATPVSQLFLAMRERPGAGLGECLE